MAHRHEVIVVGAGGAGLTAALYAAKEGADVAVVSKLYPTRSHTGAAQGGIGAALGNVEEDHWEWHMFDTVKGGDYLTDQDAAEVFAKEVIEAVIELEHMGLPFDRLPNGKIAQRRFGGHTKEWGKAPVHRAAHAADRTGHMILQTLYQQCVKHNITFYNEFHVTDVIIEDGVAKGLVALELATGELHLFEAKAIVIVNQFKAGLLIGVKDGYGVIMVKNEQGRWSLPVLINAGEASLGLQVGASAIESVYVITDVNTPRLLFKQRFNIGVDAKAIIGPKAAETERYSAEILRTPMLLYTKSAGLYAGATVKAGHLSRNDKGNFLLYNTKYTMPELLYSDWVQPPAEVQPLMALVQRLAP